MSSSFAPETPARSPRTMRRTTRELFALLGLFLIPSRNRSRALYELLATHNNLAEQSLYLNLGYWAEAESYDAACQALAEKLGAAAELGPGDRVLDCGFGFGDQDAFWLERFSPHSITGLNVTPLQVTTARQRFPDARLDFRQGSATDMPFEASQFEKVMALESAFHFQTRDDFFREARRVLVPGGRLSTADIVRGDAQPGLLARLAQFGGRALWQMPKANLYPGEEYERQLGAAGFVDISIDAIGAQVYQPFEQYAQRRLDAPEVAARLNPVIRALWRIPNSGADLEYIIASARKPEDARRATPSPSCDGASTPTPTTTTGCSAKDAMTLSDSII